MSGKYTVAEVEERTGVPASSLRQWERRYGFPRPARSASGYRLYSDDDLREIEAMRGLMADGVTASRAAVLVRERQTAGQGPRPVAGLAAELQEALVTLDGARAGQLLSEAFTLHDMEDVLLDIITPAMVGVGTRWQSGEILVTTEHFATNFIQGRLRGLLTLMPRLMTSRWGLVTCAPHERHELGALMLAVMLRRAGVDVVYLGADTPIEDLLQMTRNLRPDAVFVSARHGDAVAELLAHQAQLRAIEPLLVVGGEAFEGAPILAADLGGVFVGNDLRTAVPEVVRLLDHGPVARA